MNKIKLTKKEIQSVLDGEYIEGDFEKHHRHNGGYQDIIFEKDGKNYRTTYLWFEDDGIYWSDNYDAIEVKQIERKIMVWESV